MVEAKLTRSGFGDRQVGDQLIVDIASYQQHPECKSLICFVYDPDGHIRNPSGIEADLAKTIHKGLGSNRDRRTIANRDLLTVRLRNPISLKVFGFPWRLSRRIEIVDGGLILSDVC